MKKDYLLGIILLMTISLAAQQNNRLTIDPQAPNELKPLSQEEEILLKQLPKLIPPPEYKSRSLPAVVDNSTQPYMRQAFQQAGLCCGQAAGIGYNFTYEMDRERNVPANINDNLYPTHFTWNWMHGGNGWYGVSYLHSFLILRHCGNVNVTDYGGSLSYGGPERWMTGYDNYYLGMGNRINGVYQIHVGTPEGLEIFKHWINDHLEGAAVGGVGSFYSQYMSASNTLPAGTPEAGKYVLTYFGGSANHAQTIVGYNDSIRWDYNSDGQYTNHIDINGDGVVNMKDWEIGGFKMVQSYGGVPGWGDEGFAYMMYKTVADVLGGGGIWNNCVHVLDAKETCEPQATMKVTLTHDSRNQIKVVAGLANNISATAPQFILEYPIFNYQSGNQYMQGGTSNSANKTIEFGLDISPLLGEIALDQNVKFFLQVYEYDPSGIGTGVIDNFSVIDYTNGMNEIVCPQSNVPINNHDLTTLSLLANLNFNRVHITTQSLPPASVGQPYNFQLMASGGSTPYTFGLSKIYEEEVSTEAFPMINQYQLNPSNNSKGFVTQALEFDFPYYDSLYSSVTIHVDGYLMFDEQLFPYPYFKDDMILFRITRHISPFMCHAIRLYPSEGDGIWYEGDTTQATFRWKASIDGSPTSADINVAVRLFPSGKIEMLYSDITVGDNILWVPGLCDGNEDDMQFSEFYFSGLPETNKKYEYSRYNYPLGLSVSKSGLISGTVQQSVNGKALTLKVTDNNFVYDHKTLIFSTSGIMITDSVAAGGDEVIEYGEMVNLSVTLTNLENNPISNASMSIEINDPYITVLDGNEYIGSIAVGQSIELVNAFSFQVASDIPDELPIEILTTIDGVRQVWENTLFHLAYAPEINIQELIVDDGNNGRLDPGETTDILIHIINDGGSAASTLDCILSSQDPFIIINQGSTIIPILEPDSSFILTYNITVDTDAPIGHLADFNIALSGDMGFETNLPFELRIGLTVEDFETGDFHLFTWGFTGDRNWVIDEQYPFEGSFCARSGAITHQQYTSMILDVDVLNTGDISFFRKVSCEDAANVNYDFLSFLVDDVELSRWDSLRDWEEVSFPVEAGYHRFEWRYTKDSTVSEGLDAAFIDYISLPSCLDALPHLTAIPDELDKAMLPDDQDTDTLLIINAGEGTIEFEILITSVKDNKGGGDRSIEGSYLECEQTEFFAGETFTWSLTVYNGSDDNEWLQELTLQMPQGIIIESTTNFTGGTGGDMVFNGSFGNGPLLSWWGEDGSGWGVVHGGEYALGEIGGYIEPDFSDDAILPYVITGDIYGNEPHVVYGDIVLTNLGGNVPWISCDVYSGNVPGQDEHELMVTFDTDGLDDGHYYCNLVLRDNFQHETIIPVHLLVDTYLDVQDEIEQMEVFDVFPNPFTDEITFVLTNATDEEVSIRIVDLEGRTIALIVDHKTIAAGTHTFKWSAGDGHAIQNGMYFVIIEYENKRLVRKIIRHD